LIIQYHYIYMILPVDSSARVLPRQRYPLSISFAPRLPSIFASQLFARTWKKQRHRMAPLQPIALRRSSQWRNHQILREENLNSRNRASILSAYSSVLKSVKKCSKRAYLRSSLELLIYLITFSLLTVTPLDTWLASSCTRVTIWSHLLLERHLYSSGYLTKLPRRGVTTASLERDLFYVASTGCHHAHLLCGLACRYHDLLHLHIVHVLVNCSLASTSG